jgi:hypothetical protein
MTAQGLKARIEQLLDDHPSQSLTIGQISAALGLTKADHGDISACLVKLCNTGRARSRLGPASSTRGRRYVKCYTAIPKPKAPAPVVVLEIDARRSLAFTR